MGSVPVELVIHIFCIIMAICVISSGAISLVFSQTVYSVLFAIYAISAGVALFVIELIHVRILIEWFGLVRNWLGRALIYVFWSTLSYRGTNGAVAIISLVLCIGLLIGGILSIVFYFIPSLRLPSEPLLRSSSASYTPVSSAPSA